jgi:hypothetical protein
MDVPREISKERAEREKGNLSLVVPYPAVQLW